ncbi:uncharacterized protein LOC136025558 [Artemia franciscana]|uniref:uncharacterized protein LOC136025558 n=1 Tax=Artemia franciscana TaxID=6661 RepID=UPI0032D9E08F
MYRDQKWCMPENCIVAENGSSYVEGFHDGEAEGKLAGEKIGLVHGFDIGAEFGYYKGVASVCLSQDSSQSAKKVASDIVALLDKVNVLEFTEESEVLTLVRSKFKKLSVFMGFKCVSTSNSSDRDF